MFVEEGKRILEKAGWRNVKSPFQMVDEWEQVVSALESSYDLNIYEYDNDISIRGAIELLVRNERLKEFPEHPDFQQQVNQIDLRLMDLFSEEFVRNDRLSWWEKGILKKAGKEYSNDIKDLYGFSIEK